MQNTRFIRIEGEAVSAIEEVVHRRTTLPEWLAAIQRLSPQAMRTPVLAENTVLYAQKGGQQLVAISQPASVKKVIWRTSILRDAKERAKTRWELAIPAHLFLLVFQKDAIHSSHIFYTQQPLKSEKDTLCKTNLANVYPHPNGNGIPNPICAGSIRMDVKLPFAEKCRLFIENFWVSEFNDDIQPVICGQDSVFVDEKVPDKLRNLNEWDRASTETPNFLAEMDWPFAPICSLETILNEKWVVQ